MNQITYEMSGLPHATWVLLDGKRIGVIKREIGGYRYHTRKPGNAGDFFPTLDECKKSLEAE